MRTRTRRVRIGLRTLWNLPIAGLIGVIWLVGVLILGVCSGLVAGLLGVDTESSLTLPEVITTVLTVMTALGLAAALAVNARRQQLAETADARETETAFTARFRDGTGLLSAEGQATRVAGVYALTTLAEEYPHRAALCADVLCGYLRIEKHQATHSQFAVLWEGPDPEPEEVDASIWSAVREDLEVRLTIERELGRLTRGEDARGGPWSHLRLNLSRALLINLTLNDCLIADLVLDYAILIDTTDFSRAAIGRISVLATRFNGPTWFIETSLCTKRVPIIERAEFAGDACLSGIRLPMGARFEGCSFSKLASFDHLEAGPAIHPVIFNACRFEGHTTFEKAQFNDGGAVFEGCDFGRGDLSFLDATSQVTKFQSCAGFDPDSCELDVDALNSRVIA